MLASAALLAIAGGAGTSMWHRRPTGEPAPESLWQHVAQGLDGAPRPLAAYRGTPLLLNVWATWCAPCVREMPALEAFHRARAQALGWRTLGLAVDGRAQVQDFLRRTPVTFDVALGGPGVTDVLRALGNAQGGLPFTVLIDADARVAQRQLGETLPAMLDAWADASRG